MEYVPHLGAVFYCLKGKPRPIMADCVLTKLNQVMGVGPRALVAGDISITGEKWAP